MDRGTVGGLVSKHANLYLICTSDVPVITSDEPFPVIKASSLPHFFSSSGPDAALARHDVASAGHLRVHALRPSTGGGRSVAGTHSRRPHADPHASARDPLIHVLLARLCRAWTRGVLAAAQRRAVRDPTQADFLGCEGSDRRRQPPTPPRSTSTAAPPAARESTVWRENRRPGT